MADITYDEIKQVIHDFVQTLSYQQYKGARYVPLIGRLGEESAQWDNTAPYEPLTIVLHEGNSYMSRISVPAGVEIDDETYWAMTGEFNGQIAQLRALVKRYQAQIDGNTGGLEGEIIARQEADSALGTRIDNEATARENADTALGTRIDNEITAREGADTALGTRIDNEATARENADTALGTRIDNLSLDTSGAFEADRARITENEQQIASLVEACTNFLIGGTVTPAYQGSFMANEQNAACLFIDPYVYCFSVNNYDSTGVVRVFDRTANALYTTYNNVQLGHGNSVAYDGSRIYVLPLNTYSGGVSSRSNKLYVFNTSMGERVEWTLPSEYPYGVTYDHVNERLYYVDARNSDPTLTVYAYDYTEREWSECFSISDAQFTQIAGSDVQWQDFAIYDSVLVAAKLDGTCYIIPFDFENGTAAISGTFRIGYNTAGGMWKLGEVEGIEFDAQGRLWNMRTFSCGFRNAGKNYDQSIGFVTTLNTKEYAEIDEGVQFKPYGTLDITSLSKFKLGRYDIHSVNECLCRLDDYAMVRVNKGDTYSDTRIRTVRNLVIRVEGTMNISDLIEVDSGIMFLYVAMDDSTLEKGIVNFTGNSGTCIDTNSRAIAIYFRNRGTININSGKERFINTGYSPTLIAIGGLGNLDEVVVNQDTHVTAIGLLMGSYKVYGGTA